MWLPNNGLGEITVAFLFYFYLYYGSRQTVRRYLKNLSRLTDFKKFMMASRRKGKKTNKPKVNKVEEGETVTKHNPCAFFDAGELAQIKGALRIKEVMNIPIAIGCVILNKLESLDKAVKSGVDLNEISLNNTTALIWAIRYKYMELIEYLLEHGADPTVTVDNGDNIIIIALEHKLWDEVTFMEFWHLVGRKSTVDVNATNKNGHTILHIAVRREWERFIKELLLAPGVDLNITNINGVTPLMTACFRNNSNLVNLLINRGADFTKEDNHYRTALCYALVTGTKTSKPPFLIAERIIFELKKDLSFREYIKRRIEISELILTKDRVSEAEADMLINLIHYMVQYTENGLKLILEFKIFDILQKIVIIAEDEMKQKLLLQLSQELLCYNEQVVGFNHEVQLKLAQQFLDTNLATWCLESVKTREKHFSSAFYVLLTICTLNDAGLKWMKDNYGRFKVAFKSLPADFPNWLHKDFPEEKRQKLMKKKMKKLRRTINTLEGSYREMPKDPTEKKSDSFFSIKKSKRRSKVMKAKITKIKNMELTERLSLKNAPNQAKNNNEFTPDVNSLTSKIKSYKIEEMTENSVTLSNIKETEETPSLVDIALTKEIEANQQMVNTFMTDDLYCPVYCSNNVDDPNPITKSLKQFLQDQQECQEKEETSFVPTFPEWKSKICRLPFNDWSLFGKRMKIDKRKLKAAMQYMKKICSNYDNPPNALTLEAALYVAIDYLKELLDIVITRIKASNLDYKIRKNGNKSDQSERQAILELQTNFNQLITSISSLAHSNLSEALKNIYQLESTLLHFPINGKTLLPDVCALETVKIQYTTFSCEAETSFLSYIENVLNDFDEAREDVKITVVDDLPLLMESEPIGLFIKETNLLSPAKPKNRKKELEARVKTMSNAYHLVSSIENLIKENYEKEPTAQIDNTYSEVMLKILTKHVGEKERPSTDESRWTKKVRQLLVVENTQTLLGGEIRLYRYPNRNHVISQGGNFNLVTLGLGIDDQPLAIKRVPSEHCVCKILKSLINPLLGLRNRHLLHYFTCEYEQNDLILATPLCEYNIGQYVLLLNESTDNNIFNLTHMEIVRQFLNGLAFLHERAEPVVHGNLKPSNIFVDINGVIRLAEFGINKALFKLIEAPKTSLIWFSQETYKKYKATSIMECSLCSDIQVAGMLIYFVISGGEHPFGSEVTTILKNLEKGSFTLPPPREAKNQIFADLVSWMMMHEPNDRPQIKQVLSHVLFWTGDRRWRFILNCSGISTNGVPLAVNMTELHRVIDEAATKEQIKGHWVNVARRKFPNVKCQGDDTVVGLLKFIKHFYETQGQVNEDSMMELRSCVLAYFPAFPLTLYRIMESTGMIKEYPFLTYAAAETSVS